MLTKPSEFIVKCVVPLCLLASYALPATSQNTDQRPNILFAISDDQSYPHSSAYGSKFVETPAFDRVAGEGILFMNAWVASPGCSPSRAAILTGLYPWQIEEAGTHASYFPTKYTVLPDILEDAGYWVGFTGKGWGPGDWEASGRTRNPAGPAFQDIRSDPPHQYMSDIDYAANFEVFLEDRPEDTPFYFWLGSSEPHRAYEQGIGVAAGKQLEDVVVPTYFPDTPEVRGDLLDYAIEIEWFDHHLAQAIELLEKNGELDNTLIIVTSDNGMPFPRAKANLYDDGVHVPLAVRWGRNTPGGRTVYDLVNIIDFTPTILEAAGIVPELDYSMSGKSVMNILTSTEQGIVDPSRDAIYAGRERHSSSRWNNLGYPQRAIRTQQYLYIRNFTPERWPAGTPRRMDDGERSPMQVRSRDSSEPIAKGELTPMHIGYHDIDPAPSLDVMIENVDDPYFNRYLYLSVGRRPAEELYDVLKDPGNINNLALDPAYEQITRSLGNRLQALLEKTNDPRVVGDGDIWETYPRLRGPMREFPVPEWALPQETK